MTTYCIESQPILVVGNESMPFQGIIDNQPAGISIDILRAITEHGGPKFRFQIGLSMNRAIKIMFDEETEPVLFVSLTRLPHREIHYQWVAKMFSHSVKIFSYNTPLPESYEEAATMRAGMIKGSGAIPLVNQLGITGMEEVRTAQQNAMKLYMNRIQIVIETNIVHNYYWKQLGYDFEGLQEGLQIGETMDAYIAGNFNVSDETVHSIRKALAEIEANGVLQAILKKWVD